MKSFAFKSQLTGNTLTVPEHLMPDLNELKPKAVRVIMLVEDFGEFDDTAFKEFASHFFRKYSSNIEQIKKMIDNSK
jgi:hypothetical protein